MRDSHPLRLMPSLSFRETGLLLLIALCMQGCGNPTARQCKISRPRCPCTLSGPDSKGFFLEVLSNEKSICCCVYFQKRGSKFRGRFQRRYIDLRQMCRAKYGIIKKLRLELKLNIFTLKFSNPFLTDLWKNRPGSSSCMNHLTVCFDWKAAAEISCWIPGSQLKGARNNCRHTQWCTSHFLSHPSLFQVLGVIFFFFKAQCVE